MDSPSHTPDTSLAAGVAAYQERLFAGTLSSGLPTGLAALNRFLGGVRPSRLYAVASRGGAGTTALALSIAHACAARRGGRVGLIATDVREPQIIARLLALESGSAPGRIFQGPLSASEPEQCLHATASLLAAPIMLATPTRLAVPEVERLAHMFAQGGKLSLLILDSPSLLRSPGAPLSRSDHIDAVARGLKHLARSLALPVLLTVLLAGGTWNASTYPRLDDLGEAEGVELHADVVILLHREAMDDPQAEREGKVDLFIAKNRHGPVGHITARFDAATGQFHDA